MKSDNKFHDKLIALQSNMSNFALSLTANKEDAEDLTQETMLKVLDNEEKYTENTNFKGWVFTIMRNIFINNYRRIVRSQTMIDTTDNLYHLSLPQDSGFESPEASHNAKEIRELINSEIADEMGIPVGTVKSRIFFARKRLKEMLSDFR